MTRPTLAVDNTASPIAQRVIRLQAEAKALAGEHIAELLKAMGQVHALSAEIAKGGDVYSPGVRDLCRKQAEEMAGRAQNIASLSGRAP